VSSAPEAHSPTPLLAENRILRRQIDGRMQLTESERKALAEMGVKLGKQALAESATIVTPDTIFAWHRMFADQKVDTSKPRKFIGRPRVDKEIEDLVVRMAQENCPWGYNRIQESLKHLGYTSHDQSAGNILKRHSIAGDAVCPDESSQSACAPSDARPPQYHEMGKAVRLSDISPELIRAGPLRYRRRFRGPAHCNDCEAA
jgi:hypothetical protein